MDWGKLPDFAAVILFSGAFAAVARRSRTLVSKFWLTGWLMIALHFAAALFASVAGEIGVIAGFVSISSLVWAGMLFNWAADPDSTKRFSFWVLIAMMGANSYYLALVAFDPGDRLGRTVAATALGALPLALALVGIRGKKRPLRWATVVLYGMLSGYLLIFQYQPEKGVLLAVNGLLFTVFFGCCFHFCVVCRRRTAGALVTIIGFLSWAAVFVIVPGIQTAVPSLHFDNGVWNLPMYIVAVGMILLLLEEQIEHNQYLALHDELTGLPNRRLFQDRLNSALERARRTSTRAALLLVDLDRFKQVNDTYGHHAGDFVLKHVGNVFLARVRRSDTVARTGGDEFAVILAEPVTRADAERVGHSLIDLLKEPVLFGASRMRIGASVGVALFPDDATDAEGLCVAADLQMYDSKHQNGNAVIQAPPIPATLLAAIEEHHPFQRAE